MILPRLLLVSDGRRYPEAELVETVHLAAGAGLRWVQIREPDLGDGEVVSLGRSVVNALGSDGVVSVNGRPQLAAREGWGLHLSEGHPADGDGVTPVGRSIHSEEAAVTAGPVDYLILGTIYPTSSKPGLDGAGEHLVAAVCRRVAPLPVLAIGGVDARRAERLRRVGAWGVAVCGAILGARDPATATHELLQAVA